MEQQGPHQQRPAGGDGAGDAGRLRPPALNLGGCQPAAAMRPRQDQQRAIRLVAVVEVQAHGQHPLQDPRRGLDVDHAGFLRPRPEAVHISTLADRDRQVLVPYHVPVRLRRLVEQDAAHRKAVRPQHGRDERAHFGGIRQCGHCGHVFQQVAEGIDAPPSLRTGLDSCPTDGINQRADRMAIQDIRHDGKAITLQSLSHLKWHQ